MFSFPRAASARISIRFFSQKPVQAPASAFQGKPGAPAYSSSRESCFSPRSSSFKRAPATGRLRAR